MVGALWYNRNIMIRLLKLKGRITMDFAVMMKMPPVSEIAYQTYAINEYGLNAMFLLVGSEKALLIDTGTGVFDLPALVKSLTDKPVQVVLTHGHPDHAGAIGWFDEVYAHPDDFEMALNLSYESRRGYAEALLKLNRAAPVTAEDTVKFEKMPKMLPLFEGDTIDLGGRKVMVFETPGHTPGGLSFLDVRERIMITGDACNANTLMLALGGMKEMNPKQTIGTLQATAEKLVTLEPLYDRNYNGHIGYGGSGMCVPQPYSVSRDMASLCADLLSGAEQGEAQNFGIGGGTGSVSLFARRGAAGVRYTEAALK